MSKTIPQLNNLETVLDADVLPVFNAGTTKKVTKENLLKEVNAEVNSKADQDDLETHTEDASIHFTQEEIAITEDQVTDLDKYTQAEIDALLSAKEAANPNIQAHISSTANPHSVTKSQVGLANVDNTSDANKPVSVATQTALNAKEPANANIQSHITSTANPHSVTKSQVGLGNVDNTSDINKPVSIAQQLALDEKLNAVDFVTTENAEFRLNGERFRFAYTNNYPLIQNNYTQAQLNSFFRWCVQDGIKVVRVWCFNKNVPATNTAGNFRYLNGTTLTWREATFVQLDMVLATARAYGIKMILPLVDQWQGNKGDYVTWYNTINGTAYVEDDFHTIAGIKQYQKDFILKLGTRVNTINGLLYSEDPTIMSGEAGNEIRFTTGIDTNSNTLNSTRLVTLTAWYDEISTYWKSVFPNHLFGTGSQSQYYDYFASDPAHNGTYYGGDYTTQHALPNIDYYDFHIYPYQDYPTFGLKAYGASLGYSGVTSAGFLAHLNQYITIAKANGKPVVCGEYGVDKRNTLTTDPYLAYPRATNFANIMQDWFSRDGDGFGFWHYTNLFDDNNYNIKPDGVHTGGNANSNTNDDDTTLRVNIEARQISEGLSEGAIKADLHSSGDVVGPASATNLAVAIFDGTTGKSIKVSSVTISAAGLISILNDQGISLAGGTGNASILKTGTDGTVILNTGSGQNIKFKAGANANTAHWGLTNTSFAYVFDVNGLGEVITGIWKATVIGVAYGGTGATDAATARTNLGLGNVENTADINKPVSTAQQAALDLKANLASPALTGIPTAPTASAATSNTQIATTAFVATLIANLINSAPGALDTLGELAAQMASDESAVVALTTTVAGKLAKASNLSDLTNASAARTNLGLGTLATQSGTFSGTSSGNNTGDQNLSSYVIGAASATDNAIARFDLATGKIIQNSLITISDTGIMLIPNDVPITFGGGSGNNTSLKTGSDGTFLFDSGANVSVKIKGGDSLGVREFGYTDASFNYVWKVNTLGKMTSSADSFRIQTAKTPASATASGNAGDICWDANYVYVCVATNQWKRSAVATW